MSFFQSKKDKNKGIESEAMYEEPNNLEETSSVTKQPILPFNIKKKENFSNNTFRIPLLSFLKKNPEIKNRKGFDNSD